MTITLQTTIHRVAGNLAGHEDVVVSVTDSDISVERREALEAAMVKAYQDWWFGPTPEVRGE